MVKKLQKISNEKKKAGAELPRAIKDSAQQIWLAGLGAFAKAQEEGSKVFETLVQEGLSIQRKTQAVAEEKITEATSRVTGMASDIGNRAAGQWDKLENIFEDRVAKAMSRLGVPTSRDLDLLHARIDALAKSLGKTPPPGKAEVQEDAVVKKAAVKKTAAKKVAEAPAASETPEASVVSEAPAAKPVVKKSPAKTKVASTVAATQKKPAAKKSTAARPPFPQVAPRNGAEATPGSAASEGAQA